MKQQLTQKEIERTQRLCFSNPAKACAVAQAIIDTCQIISCATYAKVEKMSPRTIQYKAKKMIGISVEDRTFVSIVQKNPED